MSPMNPCFVCDSKFPCEHREISLLPGPEKHVAISALFGKLTEFPQHDQPNFTVSSALRRYFQERARRKVAWALKTGALVKPKCCEDCGNKTAALDAHHGDYNKPLEVKWLCRKCHRRIDTKGRKGPAVQNPLLKSCGRAS